VRTKGEHYISTARQGEFAAATITARFDSAVATLARTTKVGISAPTVESLLSAAPEADKLADRISAAILTDYHRSIMRRPAPWVFPTQHSILRYQFGRFEPDAKPLLSAFMNPFLADCYAPDRSYGNEEAAVNGRIVEVSSDATMSAFTFKCALEFVERLIPVAHSLVPASRDDVYVKQSRPNQRRTLDEAADRSDNNRALKSFQKAEPYQKPSEPRIITTIDGPTKRDYSTYIYAITAHIKRYDWYAFGRPPLAVA